MAELLPTTLSKQYRYSTSWAGVSGNGLSIQPIGMTPEQQNRFHTEVNLISHRLFGLGAAANTVYNAHGFVIFQHLDMDINRQRARKVMSEWRRSKREGALSHNRSEKPQ
jgi:hypothetical protein